MATPGKPVKVTERLPTKQDADRMGGIFVWDLHHKAWLRQHYSNMISHAITASHWMTPPPPPEPT